jgi:4-hydroxy 2-oxovalerate aldolase
MFGREETPKIVSLIEQSNVDYVEVGFIKLTEFDPEQAQFNHVDQITELLYPTKKKLSAIVEVGYGYPVTLFPERSEKTIDLVRVIMWKRMLKEGLEYCRELKRKGYEVCIQATRTEQYSDEDFVAFIEMFNEIEPTGIYIVDTFGLLTKKELFRYAKIADKYLSPNIAMGYHAHNNMQQAFSNSVAFVEAEWKHELMIDVSVMGMGRGAGNLNSEIFLHYLNEQHNSNFDLSPLFEVWDKYLFRFYKQNPWGYSIPYYLTALNGCNPDYAAYFLEKNMSCTQMKEILKIWKKNGVGIIYNEELADRVIEDLCNRKI